MNQSGIYAITHKLSGRMYIGSSINILNRWYEHKSTLRKNVHRNSKLQNAWNKYGEGAFRFHILDYVEDIEELITWEQQWMNSANPFYNIVPIAGSPLGHKHTDKARENMSKAHIGNPGTHTRPHSEEAKRKMSNSLKGKPWTEARRKAQKVPKKIAGEI